MNENNKKRREWVKTAAIVFLSVMLVLTFFSNTIMNYSLPEVAAQYVQSGSITAKIRGTGVVESGDPYNIMVKETRKVSSVAVKVGDQVQKGDVLVYLEGKESEELKTAKDALKVAQEEVEAAQNAYEKVLLQANVNTQMIQNAGNNVGMNTYRQQITAAQAEEAQAEKDVASWQEQYDKVANHLSMLKKDVADLTGEQEALEKAEKTKDAASLALEEAKNQLTYIENMLSYYNGLSGVSTGDSGSDSGGNTVSSNDAIIGELTAQKQTAQKNVTEKENAYAVAETAYKRAEIALKNATNSADQSESIKALERELNILDINLQAAKTILAEKTAAIEELAGDIATTLLIGEAYDKIIDAQEKVTEHEVEVAEQEAKAMGSTVTADIAGTVTSINAVAGKEVSALEAVAILQPEGKGYTMSFSVTNEQAKRLSVGDVADLVNSWRYEDVVVTLASIKPDPTEPGQKKLLTFDVTGSIVAGQTLNVSVGQKSANFDLIVPNSAIREDNNGKFVLSVESKSSPLGNRYVATRVDVEVLASDDTQSAISGALYGYEFIITTSNKPVEAGQLVRLPE